MNRVILLCIVVFLSSTSAKAQSADTAFITPFELSKGRQSATYKEMVDYYKRLVGSSRSLMSGDVGITDIGYPLRIIFYTRDGKFKKEDWKKEGRVVIFINNDIHAGEPDGVDASMMLLRDAALGRIEVPENIVLAVIPMYNIGGALNRNSYSRANQNGPESYGFRGNSRNLDLNRDFIKCDAAETQGFEEQFARLSPDIFLDNHVSDGADYQYTMTLLASQHDKTGGLTGEYMYKTFTPLLYKEMKSRGFEMTPYVNNFEGTPDKGWKEFYDMPRYSSGYAALFQTMAYVPETHMLKPFKDRVNATYALMASFIKLAGAHAKEIKEVREKDRAAIQEQKEFPLDWVVDTSRVDTIQFRGYEGGYKPSKVSGLPRLYYDRSKPYTKAVTYANHFVPVKKVTAPRAYIIPKTWVPVISCLRSSGVRIVRLEQDTAITVTAYHVDSYETTPHPYEKHYLHKNIAVTPSQVTLRFSEGDYVVWLNQAAKRYLVETLEPTAPDGFMAWNFFDGVLQQKEYFSDYVFEDLAATMLEKDPALKKQLEEKRQQDPVFAKDANAQLEFVYRHSPYFEQSANRYPIYRLE